MSSVRSGLTQWNKSRMAVDRVKKVEICRQLESLHRKWVSNEHRDQVKGLEAEWERILQDDEWKW